jgi:hypothetical protein
MGISSWLKTAETLDLKDPSFDFGAALLSDFREIPPWLLITTTL